MEPLDRMFVYYFWRTEGAPSSVRASSALMLWRLIQTFHVWLPSLRRCRGEMREAYAPM